MDLRGLVRAMEARIARIEGKGTVPLSSSQKEPTLGFIDRQLFLFRRERQLLQSALASVLEEENEALVIKRRLTNALLPINKLPDEILSEILLFSSQPYRGIPWGCPAFRICQRWRTCAIRTPALWSSIRVTRSSTFEQVFMLLDRSGARRLDIEFFINDPKALNTLNTIHRLIGAQYGRCQSLSITGSIKDIRAIFPLSFNLGSLTKLEVKCIGDLDGHLQRSAVQLFDPAVQATPPAIREIALFTERTSVPCRLFDIASLDVTRLTRLNIASTVTPESVWTVLQNCTSLEILGWTYTGHFESPQMRTKLVLPSLRSLTLAISSPAVFFHAVKPPRLIHLSLRIPAITMELREILQLNDLHRIRFLELQFVGGNAGVRELQNSVLRQLFSELLDVEAIRIGGWSDDNVSTLQCLSDVLLDTSPPIPYCPKLQHLMLDVRHSVDVTDLRLETIGKELALLRPQRRVATSTPLQVYMDFARFKRDTSLDFGPSSDIRFMGEWDEDSLREMAVEAINAQRNRHVSQG